LTAPRDVGFDLEQEGLSARERIREAMIDLVLANGYGTSTVEMVIERAGVDRADFDRCFSDVDDCCLKIYEENLQAFEAVAFGAFERPGAWRDRLRAAAYAIARFLCDHPREVTYDVVEMSKAGDLVQALRERQLRRLVDLIDLGRLERSDPDAISRRAAEGVVGAVYELVVGELQGGQSDKAADDFVPDLMYVAVRPYLGHEVAMEELKIPPPPENSQGGD
jgi:AcrR family transcriptional regulator